MEIESIKQIFLNLPNLELGASTFASTKELETERK